MVESKKNNNYRICNIIKIRVSSIVFQIQYFFAFFSLTVCKLLFLVQVTIMKESK